MTRVFQTILVGLMVLLVVLPLRGYGQTAAQPATFSKEQIEQLVAPIALYPDALVAQILMASTYPLEIVTAARWVKANPKLKGKALEDALQTQPWDPSVKSLAAVPNVLAMMNDKLDMTQRLGDAFLAQQKEVLSAVQTLRAKAQTAGNLKSGKEQVVSTSQEGGVTIIKVEPADPQIIYVPTYNPVVVYGTWPYPAYPPYYYYPPGYVAGTAVFSFAVGVAVGNAMWGHCNWRGGSVNININRYNSYNRTTINTAKWQHNVNHRKGVQYRDVASQQKYGKGQRQGVKSREAFRGRIDGGGRENPTRGSGGTFNRDTGRAGQNPNVRQGMADRQKPNVISPQNRAASGSIGKGSAGAFDGIGRGAETQNFRNRGAASRSQAGGLGLDGNGGGAPRRRGRR